MPKGEEVELELLGVRESVELLAAVAEIDADQTPPCCLEIAQLCGRLPVRSAACVFSDVVQADAWFVYFVALLEHSRELNPDLRQWMGGGDP